MHGGSAERALESIVEPSSRVGTPDTCRLVRVIAEDGGGARATHTDNCVHGIWGTESRRWSIVAWHEIEGPATEPDYSTAWRARREGSRTGGLEA